MAAQTPAIMRMPRGRYIVLKGEAVNTFAFADAPQLEQKLDPAGKGCPHF
jgi:hypothetical protein